MPTQLDMAFAACATSLFQPPCVQVGARKVMRPGACGIGTDRCVKLVLSVA
jgi:hypothetical protein